VERYARYRAPDESGSKLVVPSWDEMGSVVRAGVEWRGAADVDMLGMSLADFAAAARAEAYGRAADYVGAYAGDRFGEFTYDPARPVILTGHQPDLIHPGVWLKNFAAAALAEQLGAEALHMVIDADVCRGTSIRVPSGSADAPELAAIEFDAPAMEMPWEERRVLDRDCWRSFGKRVQRATTPLLSSRMIDQWWPTAVERAEATGLIGASLAQARHLAELDWQQRNLELPQSQVCQTAAFRRFACRLLFDLPRFAEAYNAALAEYRHKRRLRNHAQPVPDLAADGPWLEAPLWMWSTADPTRRPLYLRCGTGACVVSDRREFERTLPCDPETAIAELGRWEAEGVKVRSRALVTTMFARLALADMFIHGIGGARYDEVTDGICERFFGTAPPAYATLSGTLRLPIAHPPGDEEDVRVLRQQLREYDFHPERYLATADLQAYGQANGVELAKVKRQWVETPKTPENAQQRHAAITAANRGLRELVADQRLAGERRLAAATERLRANRILNSREYAFCLYECEYLAQFLLDFPSSAL
jgi:hypothetical protein